MTAISSTPQLDADVEEALAVHRAWWEANMGLDIAAMRECFAGDDRFMMFNLNGFLYFDVDELTRLWEYLREQEVDFKGVTTRIVRHEQREDTIWFAVEAEVWLRTLGADDFAPRLLRATEIYHRDTGDNAGDWRIWHFHCSDHAAVDRVRMGFSDTFHERGLGGSPHGQPLVGLEGAR